MTLIFLEESKDNIAKIGEKLLILEKEPKNIEILNDLFRYFHTLKGMYATMGFDKFADLTHKMEDLMDLFRSEKIEVTDNRIDILLKCVNVLEEMIEEYEIKEKVDIDIENYIELLTNSIFDSVDENETLGNDYIEIDLELENIELKAVRLLMFINSIEKHLDIKNMIPSKEFIAKTETDGVIGNKLIVQIESIFTSEIQMVIE